MHFGIGFPWWGAKKANAFLLYRALRAHGGRGSKIPKPKIFGGKDFGKVCNLYVRLPRPPVRTHQTSSFLGDIIKR
jgi:hypothetical protein